MCATDAGETRTSNYSCCSLRTYYVPSIFHASSHGICTAALQARVCHSLLQTLQDSPKPLIENPKSSSLHTALCDLDLDSTHLSSTLIHPCPPQSPWNKHTSLLMQTDFEYPSHRTFALVIPLPRHPSPRYRHDSLPHLKSLLCSDITSSERPSLLHCQSQLVLAPRPHQSLSIPHLSISDHDQQLCVYYFGSQTRLSSLRASLFDELT